MVKAKLRLAFIALVLFFGVVVIFMISHQGTKLTYNDYGYNGHGLHLRKLSQPFSWHGQEGSEPENKTRSTCRNSVQGKKLIADDQGFVCERHYIQSNGCCNANVSTSVRYQCSDCHQESGCCDIFETCISCCMEPKNRDVLTSVLKEATARGNILLLSVSDHFDLCLAKCRTSSHSVQHENTYINPKKKHCFKKHPPPTGAT